ncbi:MAG: DNA translocase FtsK 4TM domain-containing protein, partial [Planctomycetaceae bacterium]|nr:DNA translocase FtsK 4TM domain-containing protein [Planctomycetaceae bacterium]
MATKDKKSKSPAAPAKLPAPPAPQGQHRFVRYCFILAMSGLVLLAWLSLLSFSPTDQPSGQKYPPEVHNAAGVIGSYLAWFLRYWVGGGAYMGLLFASVATFILILGGQIKDLPWRIAGTLLLVAATSSAAHLVRPGAAGDPFHAAAGILGMGLGSLLKAHLGSWGAWIVVVVSLCTGMMLAADNLVLRLPGLGKKAWQNRPQLPDVLTALKAAPQPQTVPAADKTIVTLKPRPTPATKAAEPAAITAVAGPARAAEVPLVERPAPAPLRPVPVPAPRVQVPRPAPKPAKADKKKDDYILPSADLLAKPTQNYSREQDAQAQIKQAVLQQTLDDFNVAAQVVGYQTGPVITLFELSLSAGVKVSQVQSLANDIARALAVPGVRVVSPLPNKDTIGIEVPNMDKEIVRIRSLMDLAPEAEGEMALPLYLGKNAGGEAIVADLSRMPHMLIAGTTGSGKSVCINTIIMSLLMTRRPEDVRLILVDPKMVEMAAFEEVPHLLCPIVHEMPKAESILEWAATKMDERYELLKECNVKNIAGFNKLTAKEIYERLGIESEEEKATATTHLPYYVIIVDELADLIMTSTKEVEGHIIRIAQKARAVGIHLILATQRPSANVVTGLIKSNMPCRISFRVASRQESRIV